MSNLSINMDFVVYLPHSLWQHDLIWVIVDWINKSAHFIPIKAICSGEDYAKLYFKEIVSIFGVPSPSFRIVVLNLFLIFSRHA